MRLIDNMPDIQVKIVKPANWVVFPRGYLAKSDIEFIRAHVGEVFPAIRYSDNYYHLTENGVVLHIADGLEVD